MCRRRQRGVPGPRWSPPSPHRCSPRPRIASAYEQETLCMCLPGRGARGISSEWKEKAPPHPETVLAPPPRQGGSLGVPLSACPGEASGDLFPPPGRRGDGCCRLRQLVGGRRLMRGGGRSCWEKAEGSLVPGCAGSPGPGRGAGSRLRGRGMGTGGGRGGKERVGKEERDGGKEIAVTGVGCRGQGQEPRLWVLAGMTNAPSSTSSW